MLKFKLKASLVSLCVAISVSILGFTFLSNISNNSIYILATSNSTTTQIKEENNTRLHIASARRTKQRQENNVTIYIERKLANMRGESKLKEEKHLNAYLATRNKIIGMLPNVTNPSIRTTFHVLVDATIKVPKYDIVILVTSYALNFGRRQGVRKYWADINQSLNKNWKAFFMTAAVNNNKKMIDLHKEAMTKKDVIIQDFIENYSITCTQKIMTGLQWATANFQYDYIMKTDDDVFIDVDAVLAAARKIDKKDLYMGRCKPHGGPVLRTGKHGVPVEEFPRSTFYPYCSGGGIVFSRSLVEKMIPTFRWEHPLRIEDAYYGEVIAKLGVNYTHNDHLYMVNHKCNWYEDMLLSHPTTWEKGCMEKLQRLTYRNKTKYL